MSLISVTTIAQAEIIFSVVDPVGGQEIDNEIGTLSKAAFEALSPTVQDWEGFVIADNEPFSLGGVAVTGLYGDTRVEKSFSGNRFSFTDPDGGGPLVGNWNDSSTKDPSGANINDSTEFNFAGSNVLAVGLAWLGRDNRSSDPTITAEVTFGDSSTAMASITADGTGDGLVNLLPVGKDTFIGFSDNGSGITKLTVSSSNRHFNGWDDIGVVVPEPTSIGLVSLALLGLGFRRRRCNR